MVRVRYLNCERAIRALPPMMVRLCRTKPPVAQTPQYGDVTPISGRFFASCAPSSILLTSMRGAQMHTYTILSGIYGVAREGRELRNELGSRCGLKRRGVTAVRYVESVLQQCEQSSCGTKFTFSMLLNSLPEVHNSETKCGHTLPFGPSNL